MHGRRRRTAVGLVAVALGAAGWFDLTAADDAAPAHATTATPHVVAGAVTSVGTAVGAASGWEVTRADVGRYELRFGRDVDLTIDSWDVAADVELRPVGNRTWTVRFDEAGPVAVDAAFTFTAVAED